MSLTKGGKGTGKRGSKPKIDVIPSKEGGIVMGGSKPKINVIPPKKTLFQQY